MQPLGFFFNIKDATTTTVPVSSKPLITHSFVETPIFDLATKKQIGYKVSDDYVQQVAPNKYIVRLNNTYSIEGKGSISWLYVFENTKPEIYYPVNVQAVSTIISGTGIYYGKKGTVTLLPKPNGLRTVNITFNA
jgi:hypothetical protein